MFCFQCEQTDKGQGCTTIGVCGKTPEVAALQDLLVFNLKQLSWYAHGLRLLGSSEDPASEYPEANRFTLYAMFSTLTNVNFDSVRMVEEILACKRMSVELRSRYHALCRKLGKSPADCPVPLDPVPSDAASANRKVLEDTWVQQGASVGLLPKFRGADADAQALVGAQELLVYGLKGVCAYADHALMQHYEDGRIFAFVHEALAFLMTPEARDLGKVLGMALKCGEVNLLTMEILHKANTTYGQQSPHKVPVTPVPGKCILVSGHELTFLEELLKQTEGKGVNVYTHGEMLPAHGYPNLRKYPHLVGHFGLAWQRQAVDFGHFPGAVLMTTNCLTPPKPKYRNKIFTAGAVGWPGIPHLPVNDYSAVIAKALELPGFKPEDKEFSYPPGDGVEKVPSFDVGFGHEVVLSLADKILDAVKSGEITRFYVIGGCDGFEGERNYFTELGKKLPPTSVVLTAGCGKYRINHLDFKTVGSSGIPRLLDLGQCNDSYSAIQIALGLAKALNCGVNDLPLSIVLSWFEQKAVAVLLTLLSLGIRGIRIGPRLPAFIKPPVLKVLSEKFDLKLVDDPDRDLAQMLGNKQ